jgi:predicted esterase
LGEAAVTEFWRADSAAARAALVDEILASQTSVEELLALFQAGPMYDADVPTGEQLRQRINAEGTEYPYMLYVPEDYDPNQSYPLEFVLHGGVGRPRTDAEESFWQRSYERVAQPGRIIVIPFAWAEAYWWQDSQSENIPAILNELKATYNVDENRVTMTGISDGGTGAYFFAFKQPTQWAAFLPYIGHPGVLRSKQSGGGYRLYFENLMNKPLYIVNGENDRLYPAESLRSFIQILQDVDVPHTWTVIEEGGHNTSWLPDYQAVIEQFKADNPRDPLPANIQWVADRTDRYNRNHWIEINEMTEADRPSLLQVTRTGNQFEVDARGVNRFTLLLSPNAVDFELPLRVVVNGESKFDGMVEQSEETLLDYATQDLDRTMLFTAKLNVSLVD